MTTLLCTYYNHYCHCRLYDHPVTYFIYPINLMCRLNMVLDGVGEAPEVGGLWDPLNLLEGNYVMNL